MVVAWLFTFAAMEPLGSALAQVPAPRLAKAQAKVANEEQFARPFRVLYKTELHFMRLVCQPTKQQFERIAADGEPALKAAIKKFAPDMHAAPNGFIVKAQASDLRKPITDELLQSVRKVLTPEQAARYQKELDLRTAARKRMAVLNLVAKVDNLLILTPPQRQQLGKILEKHWKDSWSKECMLMFGSQFLPQIPDAEVCPILTDVQEDIWRRLHKEEADFVYQSIMLNDDLGDEVWDEERKPSPLNVGAAPNNRAATRGDRR
jgi:Spy/CpxP family protein refolding chaperone